jgi:guanylate kinase
MNGKLVIFSAPSGSGKTTLVRHLLSQIPELSFSISATNREPRGNEVHGEDYYFLSPEEFDAAIEEQAFLEWEEVYKGAKYGTLKSEVERLWSLGKTVIFDLDVVGGLNLKKQFNENAISVFVKVPSIETLERRLRSRRTETQEKINQRVSKAKKEIGYADQFDVVLVNDNLESCRTRAVDLVTNFIK